MEATLSRRERERLMRRRAMLQAAKAVFAEKGYMNATLEEIAQRAEFGKGTLYNYFEGGKEDILFAILDELHDELIDVIRETFTPARRAGRPFREQFHAFVEACFSFFLERRDLFLILMKEAHLLIFSDDQEKARYFKRQQDRVVGAMVPMLEEAVRRGELKPLPLPSVAHMILGNIKGCQMHLCLEAQADEVCSGPEASETAADFVTTLLLDGLLARPKSHDAVAISDEMTSEDETV